MAPLIAREQDLEALAGNGGVVDVPVQCTRDEDGGFIIEMMSLTLPDGSPAAPTAHVPPEVAAVFDGSVEEWRAYAAEHRRRTGRVPPIPPHVAAGIGKVVALIRAHQAKGHGHLG